MRKRRKHEVECGWGFCIFPSPNPEVWQVPIVEMCGPTVLDRTHPLQVGAVRLTNNTAELQAALEAGLWMLAQAQRSQQARLGARLQILAEPGKAKDQNHHLTRSSSMLVDG